MPDAAPPPKPARRRRRWLRRLAVGTVALGIVTAIAAVLAVNHLDLLARFALERVLPGMRVELGSLRAISFSRLEVRELMLRSRRTGEPLLALAGGSAEFRLADVWRAQLKEVRLDSPELVISPDFGEALGQAAAESAPAGQPAAKPFSWAIARLVVKNGRVRIERMVEQSPRITFDVSVDWRDVGVGGAAGDREHALRLGNIQGFTRTDREFFRVDAAELRFTLTELLTHKRLRALATTPGWISLSTDLVRALAPAPSPSAPAAIPAASTAAPAVPIEIPGWSVGRLELGRLDVDLADAPGPIGRVRFALTATLRDLNAVRSAATQRVTVSDLTVGTDAADGPPLLFAKRAEVEFSLADLAVRRLGALTLEEPFIRWSPGAFAPSTPTSGAATATPSPAAGAGPLAEALPGWVIGRLRCDYGQMELAGLRNGALRVRTKFAIDAVNLGTTPEAATHSQEVTVWDLYLHAGREEAPFLSLDQATVAFTPATLLEAQRIDAVRIKGGRLTVGRALQGLLNGAPAEAASGVAPVPAAGPGEGVGTWSIGTLEVAGVRSRLEDTRPGLPELRFTLNTTLTNVQAAGAASRLLSEEQSVEFANIDLRSPLDPNAKILSLRSVFVRFTLRDIARKHLREVTILRPTIYLSQDLFVYMERAAATDPPPADDSASTAGAPAGEPNWSIKRLDVKFGRLVLGSGGRSDVGLPLEFETQATDLALDNLARLQIQGALRVPRQSYEFPDYQIAVNDVEGDLRFSYPPEKGQKNLVQKLNIASVRWRQYRAKKSWVAATFDATGINGLFGGEAYGGYVNGGFSFFFQTDSPWIGWFAGTAVDTAALTAVISPENFRMTGPLNFELQLDAFRKRIGRVRGMFKLTEPGRLRIGKLDDLLANIPSQWPGLKKDTTRIALETLRDFDYDQAGGDFWFVDSQGLLSLDLSGPAGSRTFEVALHDDQETQSPWQQGKLGKK